MKLARQLSLFDSICLIVSVTVGIGIYQFLPNISQGSPSWCPSEAWLFGIWLVGGFFSLCGALSYAELASAMPKSGGDYVYLNRAYGSWAGFLFGWMITIIVRPGDIAIMAFIFAKYLTEIFAPFDGTVYEPYTIHLLAAGLIVLLTAVHAIGVREGKWTNNLLSIVKVLGLLLIVGISLATPAKEAPIADGAKVGSFSPAIAMLLVLFCFGGWNDIAYVAAEVKNPKRNLLRALVLGIASVAFLYLLLVFGLWYSLGTAGIMQSETVATDAVQTLFPVAGKRLIALLICFSAMGAVSGMIFSGARVSQALGEEHRVFGPLKRIHPKLHTPLHALVLQAFISCILIFSLGSYIETIVYTSPVLYLFFCATNLAVIVLRVREPDLERPYRVTFYPFPILIFVIVCAFLLYETITFKPWIAGCGYGVMLLGLIALFIEKRLGKKAE